MDDFHFRVALQDQLGAFKTAFPWFNTQRYWEEQILTLKEQIAKLEEPALIY